jgi:acyl-CoA hydrolase
LNHHGTLFAGRTAEWFVDLVLLQLLVVKSQKMVCLRIHGMRFSLPVKAGETVCFTSKLFIPADQFTAYVKVNGLNFRLKI